MKTINNTRERNPRKILTGKGNFALLRGIIVAGINVADVIVADVIVADVIGVSILSAV